VPDHVHISAMTVLLFALQLIIVGFIFRTIETTFPDSTLGKALAYIH
jgi:hypothetical protein